MWWWHRSEVTALDVRVYSICIYDHLVSADVNLDNCTFANLKIALFYHCYTITLFVQYTKLCYFCNWLHNNLVLYRNWQPILLSVFVHQTPSPSAKSSLQFLNVMIYCVQILLFYLVNYFWYIMSIFLLLDIVFG